MNRLFNSEHPIVCAPMNGVSDLKLALACHRAGIVPSFVPYTYSNFKEFFSALAEYKAIGSDVLVALRLTEVVDDRLTDKLMSSGITHIEFLEFEELDVNPINSAKINKLRKHGIKILLKVLTHLDIEPFKNIIDAVTIKGPEGAGRSIEGTDIIAEIKVIKQMYPEINIIASGGIKSASDVCRFLSSGADAVSIGTMFAMSKESSISEEVKSKLLTKSNSDITRLKNGASQRAMIFNEQSADDFNNTNGLITGLKTGTAGHVFVGNALDSIDKILSVQEIVDHLVS